MATDTSLERIIGAIQTATGIKPVVKGGKQSNPIEYLYSRVGKYQARLEIDINHKNLLKIVELNETITRAINDFGDTNSIDGVSIDLSGGGTFTNNEVITQVIYFDVYDYSWR